MFHPMDPVPTLNWIFEYQPTASEILTHPSRYMRAKSPQQWIQVVIYSYTFIFVGAPMWTDYSAMGKFETGRVYVVYQSKEVIIHF